MPDMGHGKGESKVEQLSKDLSENVELRQRLADNPGGVLGQYGLGDLVAQRGVTIKFDVGTAGVSQGPLGQTALAILGVHIDFTGEHIDRSDHWDLSKPHNDASIHADVPSFHADSPHSDIRPHIDL